MPTPIFNAAYITFDYGKQTEYAVSNSASPTLKEPLSVSLDSLDSQYSAGEKISFSVTVSNSGDTTIKNIKLYDDLGKDDSASAYSSFAPYTYKAPSLLYINGKFSCEISPKAQDNNMIFTIPALSANSVATIFYQVLANDKAPRNSNSSVTNTVSLRSRILSDAVTASKTLSIKNAPQIQIFKTINPNPIITGQNIAYDFFLYNYGNVSAENITFTDKFAPAPSSVEVTVNSQILTAKQYSYVNDTLTVPLYDSSFKISVPAATFSRDNVSGIISVKPGIVIIKAVGNL